MTDYDALRVWEKRIEICRRAGVRKRNPRSGMTKSALNSVHRCLTGEFVVMPGLLYSGVAPTRDGMRERVAVAVVDRLGGDLHIESWFDRLDYMDMDDTPFHSTELTEILEAMDSVKKSRDVKEIQRLGDVE